MNILNLWLSLFEITKSNLKANEKNGETFIWEAAVLVYDDYVAVACNTTSFDNPLVAAMPRFNVATYMYVKEQKRLREKVVLENR
jgi:hypothetical protein